MLFFRELAKLGDAFDVLLSEHIPCCPHAVRAARHAAMDAVHATAETLGSTLENMKVVEEMRRTLRDIRDMNKLDPS